MKLLKKTLCLVLVVVMTVSMFAVAASAANYDTYADATATAASKYAEAMDVAMGLGIIKGVEGNAVAIDGTLTRAQAAKILCYLMLGEDLAEALAAGNTQFEDVAVDHWANKYIAYAASKNILVGSNGKFNPNSPVTGYQLGKMILNALGEGLDTVQVLENGVLSWKDVNLYEGTYWTTKVSEDAVAYKLFAGIAAADLSNALTRGQAMQMVFNALKAKEAGLTTKLAYTVYQVNGDVLGLNYRGWSLVKDNPDYIITGSYMNDTKVATYAAGTAYKTIAADLGVTATKSVSAQYYANGVAKGTALTIDATYLTNNTTVPYGVSVDVYKTTDGTYKLMATVEYVVAANAPSLVTSGTYAGKYAWTFGSYTDAVVYAGEKDYTADAYYLVVPYGDNTAATKMLSVTAPAVEKATVTAKGTGYVKCGATQYNFAGVYSPSLAIGTEYSFLLATDGSVLATTTDEIVTPVNLIYVVDHFSVYVPGTDAVVDAYGQIVKDAVAAKYMVYAQGVNASGEEITYNVGVEASEPNLAASTYTDNEGKVLKATYNASNEVYDLDDATGYAVSAATIATGKVSFTDSTNNYYYNTAKYISVVGSLSKLTVAEGTLAAADANNAAWAVYTGAADSTNKTVTAVFYYTASVTVDTTYSYSILVPADATPVEESTIIKTGATVPTPVYTYMVYVAGVPTAITTYESTLAQDFYKYYVDADGIYVLAEIDGVYNTVANIHGNYITVTGLDEYADFDITGIKVVDLRTDGDNKIEKNDYVAFYAVVTNAGTAAETVAIDCIYIVPAPSV